MKVRFFRVALFSLSLLFVSCEADIDLHEISNEVTINPSIVFPLGYANIGIGDILASNNGDGLIEMNENEIYFQNTDSTELKFRDINLLKNAQELSTSFSPSPVNVITIPANTTVPSFSKSSLLNLGINTNPAVERIDSIKISSATFNFQLGVSSDLSSVKPSDIQLQLVFPGSKVKMVNGSNCSINFTPTSFNEEGDVVIKDFVINTSGNETGLPFEIKIGMKSGSSTLVLNPSSTINCKIKLSKLDFSVAFGYFEVDVISTKTLQRKVDLAKLMPDGMMMFSNPKVDIKVVSNIGTYLGFKVDYVKALVSTNPLIAPIFAWFNGHTTNSAIEVFDIPKIPGETVTMNMRTFDKDWGETNQLFNSPEKPDVFEYKYTSFIDKESIAKDPTPNFIIPNGFVKVYIKTTVPLQFNAGSFYEFHDSIDNLFTTIATALDKFSFTSIKATTLILNITNGLPATTKLTLNFIDLNGNEIPNDIQKNYTINAGVVDANGIVQSGQELKQTLSISITKDQLEAIRKADKIAYSLRVEGADINSSMHFTKQNFFDMKVGLFVNGTVQ
jgi:hypothetical protein